MIKNFAYFRNPVVLPIVIAVLTAWVLYLFGPPQLTSWLPTQFNPPNGYLYNQDEYDAKSFPENEEIVLQRVVPGARILLNSLEGCTKATLDVTGSSDFPRTLVELEVGKSMKKTVGAYLFEFKNVNIFPHRDKQLAANGKCSHMFFVGYVRKLWFGRL